MTFEQSRVPLAMQPPVQSTVVMNDRIAKYRALLAESILLEAAGDQSGEDEVLDALDGLWYAMTLDERIACRSAFVDADMKTP